MSAAGSWDWRELAAGGVKEAAVRTGENAGECMSRQPNRCCAVCCKSRERGTAQQRGFQASLVVGSAREKWLRIRC